MYNNLIILGLETSCDDTGIGVYNNKSGIISEYIYNQTIHYNYGGTVPELAFKDHIKILTKILLFTCKRKSITLYDINAIAYTKGPGLHNSLLTGSTSAHSISYLIKIPSIGVNHLEGHIAISFLFNKIIKMPCLIFLISGAHTILLKMLNYKSFFFWAVH